MTLRIKENKNYIHQLRTKLTKAQTGNSKLEQGANWGIKQWKQNQQICWEEKKERIGMQG